MNPTTTPETPDLTKPVELDVSKFPPYARREFVPAQADLTDKDTIIGLYQKLLEFSINSPVDLEQWIKNRSELEAAGDQAGTLLYIRMTCQTDDPTRAEAYRNFMENVVPAIKPLDDQLNQRYLKELKRFPLDTDRFFVYNRTIQSDIDLFRQENVPLQTSVNLLSQEYQTLCGAMTVSFEGEELTLPQMNKFLLETDRALREKAWRATAARRLQDKEKLEAIFEKMLSLRDQMARNAGFQNFTEYQFKSYHRFDYLPRECKVFHETTERLIVPVLEEILKKRKTQMKLTQLRPWDLAVDPRGLEALKPFHKVDELIKGVSEIFKRTDPALGEQFKQMASMGLLDLASRKGKAPGGYQSTLAEIRKPFIFMNAVGIDQDVRTLLHEGGHAFHALAAANQFLYPYRHAPMEFCEVASMSMELLADRHMTVFYNEEDAKRSTLDHLEDVIGTLAWVATIDAFQFWIYEHPKHSAQERKEAWRQIYNRFAPSVVDWSGLEEEQTFLWHRQLHVFEVPFYYIEYGIAQLGALQLWLKYQKNPSEAIQYYKKGLALGGSRPLPEIFKTAGIEFDFSEKKIAPLIKAVGEKLEK